MPEAVEGKSLWPVLRGVRSGVRDSLFTLYASSQRAVRDRQYKLIRFTQINKSLLYDLLADPDEMNDLAQDPAHATTLQRMTKLLELWQRRTGDKQPLTSPNPRPLTIDLSGRPRKPDRHQPEWIRRKYFDGGGGKKERK